MSEEKDVKTTMTAGDFAAEIAGVIYDNGKAKIWNLLETIMPPSTQQNAAKMIAMDTVKGISRDVHDLVIRVLGEEWTKTDTRRK